MHSLKLLGLRMRLPGGADAVVTSRNCVITAGSPTGDGSERLDHSAFGGLSAPDDLLCSIGLGSSL